MKREENGKKTEENGKKTRKKREKRKKTEENGKKTKKDGIIGSDTVPATPFTKPQNINFLKHKHIEKPVGAQQNVYARKSLC